MLRSHCEMLWKKKKKKTKPLRIDRLHRGSAMSQPFIYHPCKTILDRGKRTVIRKMARARSSDSQTAGAGGWRNGEGDGRREGKRLENYMNLKVEGGRGMVDTVAIRRNAEVRSPRVKCVSVRSGSPIDRQPQPARRDTRPQHACTCARVGDACARVCECKLQLAVPVIQLLLLLSSSSSS